MGRRKEDLPLLPTRHARAAEPYSSRWRRIPIGEVPILYFHRFSELDMLPGGYDFTHLVFWPVVALVAVGTNLIPIVLTAGIGIFLLETIKGK